MHSETIESAARARSRFAPRPETAARYAAEHQAARDASRPRRQAMIQAEIDEAICDGEPPDYIAYLQQRLDAA